MRNKRRRKMGTGFGLTALMVLSICVVVTFKKQELNNDQAAAKARLMELEEELDKAKDEAIEIVEKKAYMQTTKFIEKIAREKLGLVYEDEIIFKAKDDD